MANGSQLLISRRVESMDTTRLGVKESLVRVDLLNLPELQLGLREHGCRKVESRRRQVRGADPLVVGTRGRTP
jgi:hypothetical protein